MAKIAPRQIESFLTRPDPKCRAVLLYGPDRGLVRERAMRLGKTIVDDLTDPFRVSTLDGEALSQDLARLADEAAALSMTGGRRLVQVRSASDRVAGVFKSFFAEAVGEALIVVEAHDLGPASSLRKLFESADSAAAIGCYGASADERGRWITATLQEAGLTVEPAARDFLVDRLNTDRGVARQELMKLITYVGKAGAKVAMADCLAAVGDSADLDAEDVIYAAAGGDVAALDRSLALCYGEALAPIAILRAAQRHFAKLHLAAGALSRGVPAAKIIADQRIHFRRADQFQAQFPRWPLPAVENVLAALLQAEQSCKTTGAPDQAVCRDCLIKIALRARSSRKGAARAS